MTLPKTLQRVFDDQPKQPLGGINRGDSGGIVAPRCFRIVLWLRGGLAAGNNQVITQAVYDMFDAHNGDAAVFTSENFSGNGGRVKKVNAKTTGRAETFFAQSEYASGAGVRRYGALVEGMDEPALPYLGIEQFPVVANDVLTQLTLVELAIPIDGQEVALSNAIDNCLADAAVVSGQAGYGWFLPPAIDSLNGLLIRRFHEIAKTEYLAGMLFLAPRTYQHILDGVKDFPYTEEARTPNGGLVDIGWKTYLGQVLRDRTKGFPTLKKIAGITMSKNKRMSVITIGETPVWGTPEETTALKQYLEVYTALADVRYPESASLRNAFDDTYLDVHTPYDEEKAANLIRAYFERFTL